MACWKAAGTGGGVTVSATQTARRGEPTPRLAAVLCYMSITGMICPKLLRNGPSGGVWRKDYLSGSTAAAGIPTIWLG